MCNNPYAERATNGARAVPGDVMLGVLERCFRRPCGVDAVATADPLQREDKTARYHLLIGIGRQLKRIIMSRRGPTSR
ncbi:uncharacterized [Lates japonicus]